MIELQRQVLEGHLLWRRRRRRNDKDFVRHSGGFGSRLVTASLIALVRTLLAYSRCVGCRSKSSVDSRGSLRLFMLIAVSLLSSRRLGVQLPSPRPSFYDTPSASLHSMAANRASFVARSASCDPLGPKAIE